MYSILRMTELIKLLEEKREQNNVSIYSLCKKAGLTRSYYYRMINGGDITTSTFNKLCEALDCKVEIRKKTKK